MRPIRTVVEWMACSPRRAFCLLFVLSFAVRGALLASWMVPREYVFPETLTEVEGVARTLAVTGQYANPYILPTGPTAHPLPLCTGLLALIYGLVGVTPAGAYVGCLLGIACLSAMYGLMPWLAGKLGAGKQAGLLGGMAGALVPLQSANEVIGGILNETLTAIALSLLLVAVLRRWTVARRSIGGSVLLGMAFGAAFHLSPALLPVMLGCMVFEVWWSRDRWKWSLSAAMALGAVLACVPWAWRNYAAFGEVFFIRSNFGLELRMGNHGGAAADMEVMDARQEPVHPGTHPEEARRVRELGEMEYMRQARREALNWIRAHPAEFARLTASRFVHFWCGALHRPMSAAGLSLLTLLACLGARRIFPGLTTPERAALVIPLATYPLIYYLVSYMPRYRVPLDWLLLMLAGSEAWRWIKQR